MPGLNHQLKDKMREAGDSGRVAISSGDVPVDRPQVAAPPKGEVTAAVPRIANTDPMVQASAPAAGAVTATALEEDGAAAVGDHAPEDPLGFTGEELVLTEEDRNTFLDALVRGERYEVKFSLFNGRVTGRLRSRLTEESEAIAVHLNNNVREGVYETPLAYSVDVRNAMLAAQVAELNGVKYAPLQGPLFKTRTADKIVEPGWLGQARMWSADPKMPEAVVSAVYELLRNFERRYWTMIAHANDQNFWLTAEST